MVCHAVPPSTLQEFLEDAAALSQAGLITRSALPKGPGAALQAAVMAHHYRDMVTLQRAAILGSLALLGWSAPGIIVNPDFALGDDATAERVLGVDMPDERRGRDGDR